MTSDPLLTASALADPSRWDAAPPLAGRRVLLQASDLDEVLPGADRWTNAIVDVQPAWLRRVCERTPVGEDGEPSAAAGPRPEGEVTQAWVRGQDSAGFTTTEVLRWASGAAGEQAAAAWVADVAGEASRCPGAVVVDPLGGAPAGEGGGAAGDVVVVAVPWDEPAASGAAPARSWSAYALAAAGQTAWEIGTTAASTSAEEAGRAAGALLQRTAARVLAADDAVRLSGVDDTALAAFSDASGGGDDVTPLFPGGSTPELPVVTGTDLATAFPEHPEWVGVGRAGTGGDWMRSWCDWTQEPMAVEGEEPDQLGGLFEPEGDREHQLLVDVDVKRWRAPDGSADVGSAYTWADATSSDAAGCDGARPAAAGPLPGSVSSAAVVPGGVWRDGRVVEGGWRAVVTTTAGATAVQVRVDLVEGTAEDADAAATSAAALARRVAAHVARADAAALASR
ncbi:MAG: hypothetical protein PGN11_08960 [Quadrisphaera sp.]